MPKYQFSVFFTIYDCLNCPMSQFDYRILKRACVLTNEKCPDEGKQMSCPLQEVE